jgi:hypothetical protein
MGNTSQGTQINMNSHTKDYQRQYLEIPLLWAKPYSKLQSEIHTENQQFCSKMKDVQSVRIRTVLGFFVGRPYDCTSFLVRLGFLFCLLQVVTQSLISVYDILFSSQPYWYGPFFFFCEYGPLSASIRTNRTDFLLLAAGSDYFSLGDLFGLLLSPLISFVLSQLGFFLPLLGLSA